MSAKYSIISTEDVNAKNDDYYPSVKSKDANERKMARQLRIEKRVAAVKLQTQRETGIYIEEEKEPVEIQMEKSAGILDNLLKESQEYLENVRVANEAREFDRKESEGIGRGKVISRLEAEAAEAQKLFSEIAGKWSSIQDYKDPLHIHEDILLQKMKCDELIKEKDDLIEMLKGEVRMAERKFTSDQVKQNQDIAILGSRIEKQIDFIKKAYATEFNLIDQVISEEKRKFIEKSNEKWEDLYRKRNQEESALTEYKIQKQEEISSKIRHLNVCHEEQFRKTKIELERDIEKAQNEFERIKSLALFNRERLEYNYEVLKRRENENLIIKSQQKRRMSKLQDTISDLKTTLSDYRKTTTKKIKKTKSDIEKLRQNIVDIDDKADQFANSSEKKFKDLWKLNARDCYNLLDKIIKIDRILHEQQLGVRWTRPVYQKIGFPSIGDRQSVSSVGPKQKSSLLLKKSKSDTRSTSALNLSKSYNTESDAYKKLLKRVLKALDKKGGFLTEKCIKLLINTYEDDKQSLVTLDNVFLSLGIKKSQDIDVMADFFLPYCYCSVCAEHYSSHSSFASTAIASRHMSQVSYMSKTSFQRSNYFSPSIIEVEYTLEGIQQSDDLISHIVKEVIESESLVDEHGVLKIDTPDEDSEDDEQCYAHPKERLSGRRRTLKVDIEKLSCKYNHPLVISTVYVLAALKEFVIKYHKQQQATQIGPTMEERLSKRRCTASRSLEDEDIKRHWINLRRTFRKSHMLIWDGLREGLSKYLEILKDRKNVSEDVMKLRKTNEALKRLLADYIDHGVIMKPTCPQKSSELLRKFESEAEKEESDQIKPETQSKVPNMAEESKMNQQADFQEEIDVFEESSSTPSLSSQDNKLHLKKGQTFERRSLIYPPVEINKTKLDINRINELDRFRNITSGRNFLKRLLKPQTEKLRKTFLRDIDVAAAAAAAGPSAVPAKKRKKSSAIILKDSFSTLDDMKSVTNCIIENTLNLINVDDVIGCTNADVSPDDVSEGFRNFHEYMDFDNGSVIDVRRKEGRKKDITFDNNNIYNYNMRITPSSYPVQDPTNPDSTNIPAGNRDNAPDTVQDNENNPENQNTEAAESLSNSIAQASSEAIVDPNSVLDLLDDFGQREDINGLVGLGNFVLVGIHQVPDDFENNNGFPDWLLNILGNQVGIEEALPINELDEAHFYCQGDGLGVHPSILAVEVDGDEEDDEESSDSTNNTEDFAEVDPLISSHDVSSLQEDVTDTQVVNEDTTQSTNIVTTNQQQSNDVESTSNLSDSGI